MKMLASEGIKAKIIQVLYAVPFPEAQFRKFFNENIPSLIVEGNQTGQMRGLIREQTGILIKNIYTKYDSRPIYPEDIAAEAKKVIKR
jgi:pyruvate/2-oxoacid:ferredoxin oxidoreductase alpha subunit